MGRDYLSLLYTIRASDSDCHCSVSFPEASELGEELS